MSGFNPNWIKGKVVDRIEMRYFDDGAGGRSSDPRIVFTDGSFLTFRVHEAPESGHFYGVEPTYWKAVKR